MIKIIDCMSWGRIRDYSPRDNFTAVNSSFTLTCQFHKETKESTSERMVKLGLVIRWESLTICLGNIINSLINEAQKSGESETHVLKLH